MTQSASIVGHTNCIQLQHVGCVVGGSGPDHSQTTDCIFSVLFVCVEYAREHRTRIGRLPNDRAHAGLHGASSFKAEAILSPIRICSMCVCYTFCSLLCEVICQGVKSGVLSVFRHFAGFKPGHGLAADQQVTLNSMHGRNASQFKLLIPSTRL